MNSPNLRGYAVWVPMLASDQESNVDPSAAHCLPDPRVTNYWDGDRLLVGGFRDVLEFGAVPAWDMYMIYGPNARWDSALPPRPDFWMHQLGTPSKPKVRGIYLNGPDFSAHVAEALKSIAAH